MNVFVCEVCKYDSEGDNRDVTSARLGTFKARLKTLFF